MSQSGEPSPEPIHRALTDEHIQEAFKRFDTDKSGDLDYFELANALAALLPTPPSTPKVMALIKASGNDSTTNKISIAQFKTMFQSTDWESPDSGLPASMYEVSFPDAKLGFSVRSVPEKGIIVVLAVVDQKLAGTVKPNDTVIAVNGAPLGYVSDHKVL
jgi:hypothetical protein